jgi:hypothetical protein
MRFVLVAVLATAFLCISRAALPADEAAASEHAAVKLADGNGLFMARIVANRSVTNEFNKWQVMVVRNLTTQKKHRLVDRSPRASVQSVFLASLPPGQYEVLQVEALQFGAYYIRDSADFDPKLFTFTVEPKRTTNIGSIIYLRPYNPVTTHRFRWTFLPDAQLPTQLSYLLDAAGKATLSGETRGWDIEGIARSHLTTETRHLSMMLAGRLLQADGSILFGENFGQIAKRDADGHWTWEDTGIIDSIQVAVSAPDGSMYAAADNSVLLMREAGGNWRRLDVPVEGGLPRFLGVDPAQGLTTVWEQDEGVTVLVARDLKNPVWTMTKTVKPGFQFGPGSGPIRSFVMPLAGRLVVAVSTMKMFSSQYDLQILDTVKNEWSTSTLRAYGPISAWADGTIYSMTGPNIKQTFKTSKDWGQTWIEGASLSWFTQPFFRTETEGYGIKTRPDLVLYQTLDGGKSWQRYADFPREGGTIIALTGTQVLICTPNGRLYFSPDNGKTLQPERDSTQTLF